MFHYTTCLHSISPSKLGCQLFMEIAPYKKPRKQNAVGNLYVDESCIDCDVCRWMAPTVFQRKGVKSAVLKQPTDEMEKIQSYAAMASCPVGSIRTFEPDPLTKKALEYLPALIDPIKLPNIYHLGYHSAKSYGATPYLIVRDEGNVMIDSPRYNTRLAQSIESLGGLSMIILTHQDDVADHAKWKERFHNVKRVIHRLDTNLDTFTCEIKLEGLGIWNPTKDITIIHTPGHTAGSICILVKTEKDSALFTGDHLVYCASKRRIDGLKQFNHGNVNVQAESIRLLSDPSFEFTWILPGHERMIQFSSLEEKNSLIFQAAKDFELEDEHNGMLSIGYY